MTCDLSAIRSFSFNPYVGWCLCLYPAAEQDQLCCSPALWSVGSVVWQWASDQPVCPKWVAGPHLWSLQPAVEPAGLQVSSTVCTGLPYTSSSYSSTTRLPLPRPGQQEPALATRGSKIFSPSPTQPALYSSRQALTFLIS